MPDEDHSSNRRNFWLIMGLFLLVAAVLLGLIFAFASPSKFFSPADQVRPWAEKSFNEAFDPSFHATPPTLLTSPAHPAMLEFSPSYDSAPPPAPRKLIVTHASPDLGSRDTLYEIFPADSSHSVTLPDGNKLTLTGIAVMLPSDVEWDDTPYPQKIPDWVDPATGDPLPKAEWQKKQGVSHDSPRLFLRVKKEGEAPLRWHWPQVYDSRTHQQISSSSSHSATETHGMFYVDLDAWHQTPISLGIQFAFGDPVIQSFDLKPGASAVFGDDAVIKLLEILPNGHNSSSWGGSGSEQRSTFSMPGTPGKYKERSYVFQVWPPQNHYLMEFLIHPGKKGRMLSGNDGISSVEVNRGDSDLTKARIRRFPKLGRAVINLPEIPRLPTVTDLFETPITRTEIRYKSALLRAATDPAEVQTRMSSYSSNIPESLFPMVLTDTTPGKILREYERLNGTPLYFDEEKLELSDKKPGGPLEKLKEWWKRSKPRWLP